MEISQRTSNGFQVANLIATILIVAIHYNSKHHIRLEEVNHWNYLFQEFFTNGIARAAVPFFAFSAGLFYFKSYSGVESYIRNLKKRFWTLVIPYVSSGIIIVLGDMLITAGIRGAVYDYSLFDIIYNVVLHPLAVQFWFLRDLIILSLLAPVVFYLLKGTKGFIILLLLPLWIFEKQLLPKVYGLHLINIETLFFFSLGCLILNGKKSWEDLFNLKKQRVLYLLAALLFAILVFRVNFYPTYLHPYTPGFNLVAVLCQKASILIGSYILICASIQWENKKAMLISSFTFFVFLYHGVPLVRFVLKLGNLLVPDQYLFYLTFPVATLASFGLAMLVNRRLPSLYNFLTGNRGPGRVMQRFGEKL